MPVEDPNAFPDEPGRGMHLHLPGKMADDPDVVIPEDEVDSETLTQEFGEEVEHDRTKDRGRPNDRVFRVARHDHPTCPVRASERDEPLRETVGRPLGRTPGPLGRAAEPEVDVRHDDRPCGRSAVGLEEERGRVV